MKSGAHIQSHRYSVMLGHPGVFKTRPNKLLAHEEDFGSDESGYIVHDHPTACPLTNESGDSVSPRFKCNHIDTRGGLIGDCGTLARLEVEPVKSRCKGEQTINI